MRVPLLISLFVYLPLIACGGAAPSSSAQVTVTTTQIEAGRATTEPERAPDEAHAPSASPKAPKLEGLVARAGLTDARARAAAQAASRDTLHEAQAHPNGPTVWVLLRLARLEAHHRRYDMALALLRRARDARPSPAARAVLKASAKRLVNRRKMKRGRVAALLPLSGPYAGIGRLALRGIKQATAGMKGIELVVVDTAGDADQAAALVDSLVHIQHVTAIIGPIGGQESHAAAVVAERLEVPLMSLSARTDLARTGTFIFRHRLTPTTQARAMARYAVQELGLRRLAVLFPDDARGREMMAVFWKTAEKLGAQMSGAQGYPLHGGHFSDAIKKLTGRFDLRARKKSRHWETLNRKAKDKALHYAPQVDFDGLFIPDGGRRLRRLLPFLPYWDIELKTDPAMSAQGLVGKYEGELPPLVQVLGGSGFNSQRFAQRVGVHAHNSVFIDGFWRDGPEAQAFVEAYTAAHGRAPSALAAHAYDAMLLLGQAVKGQTDRAGVRNALLGIHEHEGVFGKTRIQGDGEVRFGLRVLTIHPQAGVMLRY